MEVGSLHPSVLMKIHRRPYLFTSKFHKSQAYVNAGLMSHLNPTCQGSGASKVFVASPSEKHNVPKSDSLSWLALQMAIAPVERIQILMQCQNEAIKSGRLSHPYKGIGNCFVRTIRNEGIFSLWRGNTANVIGEVSSKVLYTASFKYCFWSLFYSKNEKDRYWNYFAAHNLSQATFIFFVHPFDYAHTRLANDIKAPTGMVGKRQFNGVIDVFKKTLKSDGIPGLYRGCSLNLAQCFLDNILLCGMDVAVRQSVHLLINLGLEHSKLGLKTAVAGLYLCFMLPTYPLDTVRRRMMMRSGEAVKYKSSWDAFSQIIKNEGVRSLYRGASSYVLKSAIISGFSFVYASLLMMKNASPTKNSSGQGEGDQPPSNITIRWRNGEDSGHGSH